MLRVLTYAIWVAVGMGGADGTGGWLVGMWAGEAEDMDWEVGLEGGGGMVVSDAHCLERGL